MAALYHFKLCRAILVGSRNQLKKKGMCKDEFGGMLDAGFEREEVPAIVSCFNLVSSSGQVLKVQVENGKVVRDDLTGQLLDPILVGASRKKEL